MPEFDIPPYREKKEENAARFEGKGKEGRKEEGERERERVRRRSTRAVKQSPIHPVT